MSRQYFLDLAAQNLRSPLATNFFLHRHPRPDAVLLDGGRLGRVMMETARALRTPLAFPVMDFSAAKAWLLSLLRVPATEIEGFRFTTPPSAEEVDRWCEALLIHPVPAQIHAHLVALREVATKSDLYPVGVTIGPFSLAMQLVADPRLPLAGALEDAAQRTRFERIAALARAVVVRSVELQVEAGARGVFVAEPAVGPARFLASSVGAHFEPRVLAPLRALADVIRGGGADLLLHCGGEITGEILTGLGSLHPALLSLGATRDLPADAEHVPMDVVLYGNLPAHRFHADPHFTPDIVAHLADDLESRMQLTGHPFILGTDGEIPPVEGDAEFIRRKLQRLLRPLPALAHS